LGSMSHRISVTAALSTMRRREIEASDRTCCGLGDLEEAADESAARTEDEAN